MVVDSCFAYQSKDIRSLVTATMHPFHAATRYSHPMIGKMLNLPFKVLGGVARAVQTQEAKKWAGHAERDAESARSVPGMNISVPDDFDPGPIHIQADAAMGVLQTGCIVDAGQHPSIPGGLHIPHADIGIRIAELPPDTQIVVVTPNPQDSDAVVKFLRHRGLDETWSLSGGTAAWTKAGGPTGEHTP
jgi:hypothetical protein